MNLNNKSSAHCSTYLGANPGGGWFPQHLAGWNIITLIPPKAIAIGKHRVDLDFANDQQKYSLKMWESAIQSYYIFILLK